MKIYKDPLINEEARVMTLFFSKIAIHVVALTLSPTSLKLNLPEAFAREPNNCVICVDISKSIDKCRGLSDDIFFFLFSSPEPKAQGELL